VSDTVRAVLNFLRPASRAELVEKYLAQSVDLVDLERRQRELDYKRVW
jgi:hypothetical protein